jgi:hypothetical protein
VAIRFTILLAVFDISVVAVSSIVTCVPDRWRSFVFGTQVPNVSGDELTSCDRGGGDGCHCIMYEGLSIEKAVLNNGGKFTQGSILI